MVLSNMRRSFMPVRAPISVGIDVMLLMPRFRNVKPVRAPSTDGSDGGAVAGKRGGGGRAQVGW